MKNGESERGMDEKRKREPDDKEQSARFLEDARRLGMDESGKSFERVLKKVVPEKKTKPRKK
jgi:hypothetical protein